MVKYKVTVRMKGEWSDFWIRKPSRDRVFECFADEILKGEIDDLFEIVIEKTD